MTAIVAGSLADWLEGRRSAVDWLTGSTEQGGRLLTEVPKARRRRSALTAVVAGSLVDWLPEQGGLQLSRFVEVLLVTPLTKTSCFVASQQEDFTLWRFYFKHSRTPTSD